VAGRRPTRQEVNRRRERTGFVGRRGELAVFRETFARDPEEPDFPFLFHVRGNGGVGKSTLVRQWETTAREQPSVVTAFVDDDVHDPIEAMEAVSARLAQQGHPLKKFDKQLAVYRQRRHQAESAAPAPQPGPGGEQSAPAPVASPSSTVAAQVGLAGLGMLPGVGAFVGAVDPQQVALGADRMRSALNMRLRSHDDVQLVMNPVAALAPFFLDDLADVAERCERVVLFFDVYERTGPVLDVWLHDITFGEEHGSLPVNVQVVLSGQLRLDARTWGDRLGQVTEVSLEVFTEEEARTLLATHGVTDEPSVELVLRLSGRLPLLVDMLARSDASAAGGIGDPSETAVERFLKWEPDAGRREAALACALPLQLNEDVYRAAVPEAVAEGYPWLRALAFVSTQAGRCRYHDVVRAAMLRLQRTQSPTRWQRAHLGLAELFRQWREGVEAGIGPDVDSRWEDATWREHRLNETYHRLCADPRTALPEALYEAVHAVDHDIATLRRWAQILGQAGQDSAAPALGSWSHRLEAAADQEGADVVVLTVLLTAPELSASGRALAHTVRAREYRVAGEHERALADYAVAIRIDPDVSRPYAGRGETYRVMGRLEDAVTACTRAVEIDPRDEWAFGSRGDAYRGLGRYDEAFADFARAIELDPQYAWAFGSRAQVHEALGRPDEAVADYTRAVGLDPQYAWAFGSRAYVHQTSGRFTEALADYTAAIGIDPQYEWAIASRARVHHLMGRHEDALADFARAVEIDPDYAWAVASRADTYVELGRYEEALADYSRAIEINPRYEWALTSRGELYRTLGRNEEALADYSRAVEIDPAYDWALTCRGLLYRLLGRDEESVADYTRVVEISPPSLDLVAVRAEMNRGLGRYEDALADYGLTLGDDDQAAWLFAGRAQLYLCLGRHEEAVADCVRAVRIDPEAGWFAALYSFSLRLAGEEREAGAHFRRAIGLLSAEAEGGTTEETSERYGVRSPLDDLAILRDVLRSADPGAEPLVRELEEALRAVDAQGA